MKPVATYQKLRGGYYTPQPIADFLANWAIQSPDTSVLEPSCGDGVILASAVRRLIQCGAKREDIYHNEAEKLPLPLIGADALNLEELDRLLRENDIKAVLDITDRVLLQDGLGLSGAETTMLRAIWRKLRDRRINRKPDSALKRI